MDKEAAERERINQEWEKRKRYLAMSDEDALTMPHVEQYDRICYLREKFAAEWLAEQQKNIPRKSEAQQKCPDCIKRDLRKRKPMRRSYGDWD